MGNTIPEGLLYPISHSVNYIISGNTVEWYFTFNNNAEADILRPLKRLFANNFGSVVGGSFLNAFFHLFGLIYDLFRVKKYLRSVIQKEIAGNYSNAANNSAAASPACSTS
jgi:hypothetical protein